MDIEDEQLHIENQSALWAAERTAAAARESMLGGCGMYMYVCVKGESSTYLARC